MKGLAQVTRTLMMDTTKNTAASAMVNWNMVFSSPRRVRPVDWAAPKRPLPPSLTWDRMMTTMDTDIRICIMLSTV